MTTLIVIKDRLDTFHSSDGVEAQTYRTLVREEGTYKILNTYEPLVFPTTITIEKAVKVGRRYHKKKLGIPDFITKKISEFLQQHYVQGDMFFDCYDFVNFIYGHKYHVFQHWLDYWEIKDDRKLEVGTVIFIVSKTPVGFEFHHAAIYLGFDVFASVYGAGGGLEFTDLKLMQKVYGDEGAFLALPRATTAAE